MWRTAGSPIMPASLASAGIASATTGEVLTSTWRVIAPILSERPFSSMPDRPSTSARSTSCGGPAKRNFMVGNSVWPPARSLASSFLLSRPAVWRSVCGRWKVKAYIAVLRYLVWSSRLRQLAGPLQRRPHVGGRGRHIDRLGTERIGDRVHHRRRRGDGAGFAAALDAQRIGRAFGLGHVDLERRQIVGARHGVVHVGAGDELALVVVDGVLEQRLADALRHAAVHLALDDHRIDHGAEIVDRGPARDRHLAGIAIDLDFANVTASREGEIGRVVERGLFEAGLDFAGRKFVKSR